MTARHSISGMSRASSGCITLIPRLTTQTIVSHPTLARPSLHSSQMSVCIVLRVLVLYASFWLARSTNTISPQSSGPYTLGVANNTTPTSSYTNSPANCGQIEFDILSGGVDIFQYISFNGGQGMIFAGDYSVLLQGPVVDNSLVFVVFISQLQGSNTTPGGISGPFNASVDTVSVSLNGNTMVQNYSSQGQFFSFDSVFTDSCSSVLFTVNTSQLFLPQEGLPTNSTCSTNYTLLVNQSSLTCRSSSSSSSTGDGGMYSDPFFHGFWHQEFYVHGSAGSVYNLLSDQHMQLSSRFVYLSNITCPTLSADELSQPAKVHCSSHPGTYFGEIGLVTHSGDRLYIAAGSVTVGFAAVQVNGLSIEVGQFSGARPLVDVRHELHTSSAVNGVEATTESEQQAPSSHPARSSLYVHCTSARSLVVHAGLYEMLIENSDNYLDVVTVHITSWPDLVGTVQPSGLLGVTWNNTATIPPSEEDHRERDGELMGCNVEMDKFCAARGIVQQ